MLSAINSILKTGKSESLFGENIGICETSTDGSFFIHYFLSASVKEKRPVCFVALTQSFKHYNNVSQKLGVGLQTARDAGYLDFVEGMKHLSDAICEQTQTSIEGDNQEHTDSEHFSLLMKSQTLQPLLIFLRNKINKNFENQKCLPVVIIDNIGFLLNIGVSAKDVVTFMHYLNNCLFKTGEESGLLVTLITNTENDEQSDIVWKSMCHSCSLTLHVAGLESGYCKDVHGEISVVWRDGHYSYRKMSSQKFQFKLTEKNIDIFAVGMSSAVL
ncbi:elongator complex protein 6-like [Gigantopelta aegis]|uniref:elongator complex protein 6-like n=1 Tax=Gigantopelta aegis TaxID=1735272 RepID=UPI001B88B22C|nr:elongator complex protein 6-like [Gigantopelta aegis]